jgi:hypothetical protein
MIFGQEDEHVVADAQIMSMLNEIDLVAMGRDGGPLALFEQQDILKAIGVDPKAFFERADKERKGT